jgi:hypothetical protein
MNGFAAAGMPLAAQSQTRLTSGPHIFSLSMMPRPVIDGATFQRNSFRTGYNLTEWIQKHLASLKNE